MLITNQTNVDYWFGPMHLLPGNGSTLYLDDTSDTSLYLIDDSVADMVNTLQLSGMITVSGAAAPFPRPTGTPDVLHGYGSPQGLVYAPQGSLYLRRDISQGQASSAIYTKTTGVTVNTGWVSVSESSYTPTLNPVGSTTTETDLFYYSSSAITSGWPIPANTLGTTGAVRLTLGCDLLCNAAATGTLKIYYGSSAIYAATSANPLPNSATHRPFSLTLAVQNAGGTGAQALYGWASLGTITNAPTTGLGNPLNNTALGDSFSGTGAADSTQLQNFRATWTWSASSASAVITPKTALIEYL